MNIIHHIIRGSLACFGTLLIGCSDSTTIESAPDEIIPFYSAVVTGDYYATTSEHVEALFPVTYVAGNLTISAPTLPRIELPNLKGVGEFLIITYGEKLTSISFPMLQTVKSLVVSENKILENLDGLSNLSGSMHHLKLSNNASLSDISGLSNIIDLKVSLSVSRNSSLERLDGLIGLNSINESVFIGYNENLYDISGLVHLAGKVNSIALRFNKSLRGLTGLEGISQVGWLILLEGNDSLDNIDGLQGIKSAFSLRFVDNESLKNLDGFINLVEIEDGLEIIGNSSLADINGLRKVSGTTTMRYLKISENPELCQSLVDSYSATVTLDSQDIRILTDNKDGC